MNALPGSLHIAILRTLRPAERKVLYTFFPELWAEDGSVEKRCVFLEDRVHEKTHTFLNDADWTIMCRTYGTVKMIWEHPPPQNVVIAKDHLFLARDFDWDSWFRPETPMKRLMDSIHVLGNSEHNPFLRVFNTGHLDSDSLHSFLANHTVREAVMNNPAQVLAVYGYYPTLLTRFDTHPAPDGTLKTAYEVVYRPMRAGQWYVVECGQVYIVDPTDPLQFKLLLRLCMLHYCAVINCHMDNPDEGTVGDHIGFARLYHDPTATLSTPGVFEELNEYIEGNMEIVKHRGDIKHAMGDYPCVLYYDLVLQNPMLDCEMIVLSMFVE